MARQEAIEKWRGRAQDSEDLLYEAAEIFRQLLQVEGLTYEQWFPRYKRAKKFVQGFK
jgi:hypothetical protein